MTAMEQYQLDAQSIGEEIDVNAEVTNVLVEVFEDYSTVTVLLSNSTALFYLSDRIKEVKHNVDTSLYLEELPF